jgi:hypothetical protein
LNDLLRSHTDFSDRSPSARTYVLAMNKASYDRLPRELKSVIDNNSGQVAATMAGAMWDQQAAAVANMVVERGDLIVTLLPEAVARWRKATEPVVDAWRKEIKEQKIDGAKLIAAANVLLAKYANEPEPQSSRPPQPTEQQAVTRPQPPQPPQAQAPASPAAKSANPTPPSSGQPVRSAAKPAPAAPQSPPPQPQPMQMPNQANAPPAPASPPAAPSSSAASASGAPPAAAAKPLAAPTGAISPPGTTASPAPAASPVTPAPPAAAAQPSPAMAPPAASAMPKPVPKTLDIPL